MTDQSPYARRGLVVRLAYLVTAIVYWLAARIRGGPTGTVVLCYHAVRPAHTRRFAWQMRHVAGCAAPTATLTGTARRRANGPPRVCVTFDDGFQCVLDCALPIMRQMGVPASIFVIPGRLGSPPAWSMPPDHPDRDQLVASGGELARAAYQGLCSIGSHTLSHAALSRMPGPQLRYELTASKAALESLVDAPITELALPYGAYDAACIRAAFRAGYQRVFTLEPQVWRANADHGVIGRFVVSPEMWRLEFALTCAGAYAWLAAWRRLLRRRVKSHARVNQPAPQETVEV